MKKKNNQKDDMNVPMGLRILLWIQGKKMVKAEIAGRVQSGHDQKTELGPVRRGKEGQELRGQEAEALSWGGG